MTQIRFRTLTHATKATAVQTVTDSLKLIPVIEIPKNQVLSQK